MNKHVQAIVERTRAEVERAHVESRHVGGALELGKVVVAFPEPIRHAHELGRTVVQLPKPDFEMSVAPMWDMVTLPFWWWKNPEKWSGPQPSFSFEISVTNTLTFDAAVKLTVDNPDPFGHHISLDFEPTDVGKPPFSTKLVLKLLSLPPIQEELVIKAEGGGIVQEAKVYIIWDVDGLRYIPVHVILAALDDGSDAPVMPIAGTQRLLSDANRVYNSIEGGMGIRFIFDPVTDLETVTRTDLQRDNPNGVQDGGGLPADFSQDRTNYANQYPGKVVVYFRNHHDNDAHYAGAGNFSSAFGDYVVLHPDPNRAYYFAHEVGHYLGLSHPFGKNWKIGSTEVNLHDELYAIKDMQLRWNYAYGKIREAIMDKVPDAEILKELFDADGLEDTPPDEPALFGEGISGMDLWQNPTCEFDDIAVVVPDPTMPVGFRIETHHYLFVLKPDKDNVMGYYPPGTEPNHITAQQGKIVRASLETGRRKDLLLYNP